MLNHVWCTVFLKLSHYIGGMVNDIAKLAANQRLIHECLGKIHRRSRSLLFSLKLVELAKDYCNIWNNISQESSKCSIITMSRQYQTMTVAPWVSFNTDAVTFEFRGSN